MMSEEDRKIRERLKNLEELVERNVDPFAEYSYERTHKTKEIVDNFDELEGKEVKICGRLSSVRRHGKISFFDLKDISGEIQLVLKEDNLEDYGILDYIGRGDHIGVVGNVMKTRTEEISVEVGEFKILSKCLRNLPSQKTGLEDPEKRFRQRYLDLMTNDEVRDRFVKRHEVVKEMRNFLNERDFVEIETPVLQEIYGGALARPFKTQHNMLDREFYLRISNELYLKRLIVGGFENVYEFVKDFRNEGIDRNHNPEFTQVELYQAYTDYKDIMKLTEDIISHVAKEVMGKNEIEYQGQVIDFSKPWRRISMVDSLKEFQGIDVENKDKEDLVKIANEHNLEVEKNVSRGELIAALFEELVEDDLVQPTLIYDYPVEVSPLAKKKRGDPRFTERFEIFVCGMELGNAFSELNNPLEQKKRFEDQVQKRNEGDMEAHEMDKDYIRALEYGMPPTGGLGIGIDRLVMILTNAPSIKEVIAFPQLGEIEGLIELHGDMVKDKVFKK
ncbi:MAG: lysine--tRNA ligase [Candidatus Aenigmatarchaeota archaeon]